ncbi:MAG: insulinase family protein [Planctomycetes bacterium]|nr:insulinase family protein [Planctomycetota bacterium]MCB9869023.1 insulinase family protein [Planctomycetota bacterium]MCB9887983.1 insulinase family protein [Planctomycetota bacterium]
MRELDLQIAERLLDNGLTVIAVRNPTAQTFAASAVLDVDMRDEQEAERGLAYLIGECFDEGTRRRSGVELAQALDDIGCSLAGHCSGAAVTGPAKDAEPALALLREVLFEPSFPAREVARVKDEIRQEIEVDLADPRAVAQQRFRREVYGPHPYAHPEYGSAEHIARHDPEALHGFHRRWYVPRRGYVALAGPLELDRGLDVLAAEFAGLEGTATDHRPAPEPGLPEPSNVHLAMEREQVHVFVGHPGIRRTDPDYHALVVMDHILGSGPGFTARIPRRLRDEQGLCYTVHASISHTAGEEPGTFAAYIGTSPAHRDRAIAGFLEEIERIRQDLPDETELVDVRDYLTGSYVFSFERNAQLARHVIRAKRLGLGFDHLEEYPERIRAVTREDVLRVARAHLHPDHMVRVSAGGS